MITRASIVEEIGAYLQHRITLPQLVDWAERVLMDGNFATHEAVLLATVVARLGVADVRAFGLTWEDCEGLLRQLGYTAHVQLSPA
ncbi:MAG: hypothetical protein ACR2IE_10960 [Candidatus Sumerlaeaceae bacterium]